MADDDTFFHTVPLCIAHRGASDVAPENTMAAFEAAIAAGADAIELDVTRCYSGEVVVIHDDTVDRTTNGSGRVADLPLDALRALDAGSWFSARFAGQRIPTLDEVLAAVGDRVRLNVEIKGPRLRSDGIEAAVVDLVRAHGLAPRVLVSSFNPAVLWRVRRLAPELRLGLLYAPDLPVYLSRAWARHALRPTALHPYLSQVDADTVRQARARGYRLNVWTVDQDADLRRMIALRVDGIITNRPARLRALIAGAP